MEIKKILMLADPEADYGQYMIWNGLVEILGNDNVVTFPFKRSLYGENDDTYFLPDGKQGFTSPYEFTKQRPKPKEWSMDDVIKDFDSFDVVIISSMRKFAIQAFKELREKLGFIKRPVIALDHEDYSGLDMWKIDDIKPDAIFKREMLMGEPYPSHYPVYPLPFSSMIEPGQFPDKPKIYDVCFACGITYPIRQQVLDLVMKMPIKFIGGGNEFRRSWQEYNELMSQSKICLVVRGWGWDSVRAWEAPAHNTMTMWFEHPQIIPNPFVHKDTTVYFNIHNLENQILQYLANDEERQFIAQRGQKHLFEFHTNKARAQYMLDILNKL